MNKRNRYLAIAGMACTAAGLLTSVGGTWAMLQGHAGLPAAVVPGVDYIRDGGGRLGSAGADETAEEV